MSNIKDVLRFASLAAVLLAGSCAAPINDGGGLQQDGAINHPIVVEPTYQTLKLPFSVPAAGLMPDDAAHFNAFVSEYMASGNGAISISAPAGSDASAAIGYFGERLAAMGVPRARILVGTHDVMDSDRRVELGYIGYAAHTDTCGDWSKNLGDTSDNRTGPNFGCSVQQNIAAMVSDPRDLIAPRGTDNVDAVRRAVVLGHYEKGEITQADKNKTDKVNEQSGTSSQVDK
jgi:pilus assembly protein CpaD